MNFALYFEYLFDVFKLICESRSTLNKVVTMSLMTAVFLSLNLSHFIDDPISLRKTLQYFQISL